MGIIIRIIIYFKGNSIDFDYLRCIKKMHSLKSFVIQFIVVQKADFAVQNNDPILMG